MSNNGISLWEEHQFWLEILEDHALFIFDYLASNEKKFIETAKQYMIAFNQLRTALDSINRDLASNSEANARKINPVAIGYYQFEGHLQQLRIKNQVNLNLVPSYLNGTLNENEEYIRLLTFYIKGKSAPALSLVDLLDLWLEDQLGHAALLIDLLDPVELELVRQAEQYKKEFSAYIVKNDAMKGFLRFTPPGFPAQKHFAREVIETVIGFTQLVKKVVQLYECEELLNSTTLRFILHHFPEACYFLKKLHPYTPEVQIPDCSLKKLPFS